MFQVEIMRIPLLEVGEAHRLTYRFIDSSGSVMRDFNPVCSVAIDNADVMVVTNQTLMPLKPGSAKVTVQFADDRFPIVSWDIKVTTAQRSIHTLTSVQPRILFLPDELAALRSQITNQGSQTVINPGQVIDRQNLWRSYLKRADQYVLEQDFEVLYPSISDSWSIPLPLVEPEPVPDPQGYTDFPYWTMYSRAIEERLVVLSTVYLVTKQIIYANKAKSLLLAIANYSKWYEFDHRGAEGNLSNAHFLIGASTAYDSFRNTLTEEEQLDIQEAILCLGLQPLAIDIGNRDMHNIVAAKHVAMMFGAAAISHEVPYAHKYLQASYEYLKEYLDRKLDSGETEGLLYDNVAARHAWMAGDLYRRITGDAALVNHPYLREELPERFLRLLSPGEPNTFPNMSDSFYKLDIAYLMAMTATHHLHPAANWYIQRYEHTNPAALLHLKWEALSQSPDQYYHESASCVFSTIGWAALRSGWNASDHLLCFSSGPSARDHNHKDQNQFLLNVGGEWLLTGPGYQDYVPGPKADYTTGTVGHNSLLVNGLGQEVLGGGLISNSWLCPSFEVVSGDASASYKERLRCYQRTLFHMDSSYYIMVDDVELNHVNDEAELLFHTTSQVKSMSETVIEPGTEITDNVLIIQGERTALQLIFATPEAKNISLRYYPGAESYGPHVSVKAASGRRLRFVTLIRPLAADKSYVSMNNVKNDGHSGAGFSVPRYGEEVDIILLSDETQVMDYEGFELTGFAARCTGLSDQLETLSLGRIHLWLVTRFEGHNVHYHSDFPLSLGLDTRYMGGVILNDHSHDVFCKLSLSSFGIELALIIPPGEHELDLIQGRIIDSRERGEAIGNRRS